jgi:hypothetical protein
MLQFACAIQRAGEAAGLTATFDDAYGRLAQLPRLFIEPDGSFVWRGTSESGEAWQVDGNLVDRGASLAYVELKGRCPVEPFEQILSALGWPGEKLAFALPRLGIVVDEAEFRERAMAAEGAG